MCVKIARLAALLVAGALVFAACGGDDDGGGDASGGGNGGGGGSATIDVTTADFAFSSDAFEVPAGAEVEVTLTNDDDVEHGFTIEDPELEIEAHGGEEASGSFTAPDSGSFEFFCQYHPDQMRGEITVG
jgi:plastocyanin